VPQANCAKQATTAGNLLQRTRCPYSTTPTNHATNARPGSGCAAIDGFSRQHAVIGASKACNRDASSEWRWALRALDAKVETVSPIARHEHRDRRIASLARRHAAARDATRARRTDHLGDAAEADRRQAIYRKVRDRASFAFALVSVGAISCRATAPRRLALGGVAHKPWRVEAAESELHAAPRPLPAKLLPRHSRHARTNSN